MSWDPRRAAQGPGRSCPRWRQAPAMLLAQNARNVSLLAIGVGAPLFCGEGCFTALNRPGSNYEGTWGLGEPPLRKAAVVPQEASVAGARRRARQTA